MFAGGDDDRKMCVHSSNSSCSSFVLQFDFSWNFRASAILCNYLMIIGLEHCKKTRFHSRKYLLWALTRAIPIDVIYYKLFRKCHVAQRVASLSFQIKFTLIFDFPSRQRIYNDVSMLNSLLKFTRFVQQNVDECEREIRIFVSIRWHEENLSSIGM